METPENKKISARFSNLDAVRGLGVTILFIAHIETLKSYLGFPNFSKLFVQYHFGFITLVVFFVLSGFLITHLLLSEKTNKGEISALGFYKRRIYRLWPVYYLAFGVAVYILPHFHIFTSISYYSIEILKPTNWVGITLFLFHQPDVAFIKHVYQFIGQFWSIGVEEKFYFIWPLLLKYAKNPLKSLLVTLAILLILKTTILLGVIYIPGSNTLGSIHTYFTRFMVDSMLMGGIIACLSVQKHRFLERLYKRSTQWAAGVGIALLLIASFWGGMTHYFLFAPMVSVFILNMATNPNSLVKISNPVTNYIGKISYGMYMYSIIVIVFTISIAQKLHLETNEWQFNVFIYLFSYLLATTVSSVSYYFFEKKFTTTTVSKI